MPWIDEITFLSNLHDPLIIGTTSYLQCEPHEQTNCLYWYLLSKRCNQTSSFQFASICLKFLKPLVYFLGFLGRVLIGVVASDGWTRSSEEDCGARVNILHSYFEFKIKNRILALAQILDFEFYRYSKRSSVLFRKKLVSFVWYQYLHEYFLLQGGRTDLHILTHTGCAYSIWGRTNARRKFGEGTENFVWSGPLWYLLCLLLT